MIPKQLQQPEFRFIKLGKRSKLPVKGELWGQEPDNFTYGYNDQALQEHLISGGNYGILGGYGNLLILDFDDYKIFNDTYRKLPPTLGIKTSRGMHLYYFCDDCSNADSPKIEFKGSGRYVVAPGSIHPDTGSRYSILFNKPIAKAERNVLEKPFENLLKKESPPKVFVEEDILVDIYELLEDMGINHSGGYIKCLWHEDNNPSCKIYPRYLYCFGCKKRFDVYDLIQYYFDDLVNFPQAKKVLKHYQKCKDIIKAFMLMQDEEREEARAYVLA